MNICFCNHHSNCQNIDKDLYACSNCSKLKAPFTVYDRYGNRTTLTLKSIFYFFIELFKDNK